MASCICGRKRSSHCRSAMQRCLRTISARSCRSRDDVERSPSRVAISCTFNDLKGVRWLREYLKSRERHPQCGLQYRAECPTNWLLRWHSNPCENLHSGDIEGNGMAEALSSGLLPLPTRSLERNVQDRRSLVDQPTRIDCACYPYAHEEDFLSR